ncbi:hypothetical protein BH23ACT9_BH23ACT9_24440 [soil metagenome]
MRTNLKSSILKTRTLLLLVVIAMLTAACAADDPADTAAVGTEDDATTDVATDDMGTEDMGTEDMGTEDMTEDMGTEDMTEDMGTEGDAATDEMTMDSAQACDADSLVEAVEGGPEDGTLSGMADAPVGTAASNNPVLTTLVTAVQAAGLLDTLNAAESLTVFAPTDCAFAEADPETVDAALADPQGLLTQVLGFHVIEGQRLASDELSGEYTTFTGETITVEGDEVDGQASIVVPDIQTANATVHLIDTLMLPPSVADAG